MGDEPGYETENSDFWLIEDQVSFLNAPKPKMLQKCV